MRSSSPTSTRRKARTFDPRTAARALARGSTPGRDRRTRRSDAAAPPRTPRAAARRDGVRRARRDARPSAGRRAGRRADRRRSPRDLTAAELLRAGAIGRQGLDATARLRTLSEALGDAEVEQLHPPVGVDQDVRRLEVTMNHGPAWWTATTARPSSTKSRRRSGIDSSCKSQWASMLSPSTSSSTR